MYFASASAYHADVIKFVVGTGVPELCGPCVAPVPYYPTAYRPTSTLTSSVTLHHGHL